MRHTDINFKPFSGFWILVLFCLWHCIYHILNKTRIIINTKLVANVYIASAFCFFQACNFHFTMAEHEEYKMGNVVWSMRNDQIKSTSRVTSIGVNSSPHIKLDKIHKVANSAKKGLSCHCGLSKSLIFLSIDYRRVPKIGTPIIFDASKSLSRCV